MITEEELVKMETLLTGDASAAIYLRRMAAEIRRLRPVERKPRSLSPRRQFSVDVVNKPMSLVQRKILDAIISLTEKFGYPPTREEIAFHCGYPNKACIQDTLMLMHAKGLISSERNKPRTLKVVNVESSR